MAHHGDGDGTISPAAEAMNRYFIRQLVGLGPTGKYPEGKLNPDDEGEIRTAIGTENGKVKMDFGKPIAWIGFTEAQAREIAALLVKHADSLKP